MDFNRRDPKTGRMAPSDIGPVERFWSKADRSGGPDACWLWTGWQYRYGYGGCAMERGKSLLAHRVAYELAHGPIPPGMEVCHNCPTGDNPLCVNPRHLWLGTRKDNQGDMARKGRAASGDANGLRLHPESVLRGERHPGARLSDADVVELVRRYRAGETRQTLAKEYGLTRNYTWVLTKGKGRAARLL